MQIYAKKYFGYLCFWVFSFNFHFNFNPSPNETDIFCFVAILRALLYWPEKQEKISLHYQLAWSREVGESSFLLKKSTKTSFFPFSLSKMIIMFIPINFYYSPAGKSLIEINDRRVFSFYIAILIFLFFVAAKVLKLLVSFKIWR